MVMSLVSLSTKAQKTSENNFLANLEGSYTSFKKYDILHAVSSLYANDKHTDLNPLEDWMMNLSEWNLDKPTAKNNEADFTESEIVIEGWMSTTNWENTNQFEQEIPLEDWMMNPIVWNK